MSNNAKIHYTPSIRRLPSYLNIIQKFSSQESAYISGTVIANELSIEPIQVRKDLAITGIVGRPKKGYRVKELIDAIEGYLGWNTIKPAVIVGAGNLGSALMGYSELKKHGLNIVAAFDSDVAKTGKDIHGVPVFPISQILEVVREKEAKIAVLTVPAGNAQEVATKLVDAGITSIWNFTHAELAVPENISMQKEDLSSGYALLCIQMKERIKNNAVASV